MLVTFLNMIFTFRFRVGFLAVEGQNQIFCEQTDKNEKFSKKYFATFSLTKMTSKKDGASKN